jgi:transposase
VLKPVPPRERLSWILVWNPSVIDLLSLPNIRAVASEKRDGVLYISAQTIDRSAIPCLQCSCTDPYRHDSRDQVFADAPVRGDPVRIQITRQRFRCRGCGKTFFEPLEGFSDKRNMTRRLVHYVAYDSLIQTFSDVARDVGLDVQTVRGVFKDFAAWLRTHHSIATPRVLGIDEAKRAKVLCSVFTDLERREYFDMIPSRMAKPLSAFLGALPDKERVEVVAMDLHLGFVTAIGRHLPKAIRVADKYHIARLAQDGFDKAHIASRKGLATGARLAMFRHRGLLAERRRGLTDQRRRQAEEAMAPFPVLRAAYEAKEAFLEVYEARSRSDAERLLSTWLERLPLELSAYFRALTSAVSSSREIILNYFDHPYTNAFTEAANGLSKLMQRMGRGYGFEVMRIKLLYGKRAQSMDLSDFDGRDKPKPSMALMTGGFGRMAAAAPQQRTSARRRGPNVQKVAQLVEQGYYDPGNKAIAAELEPLIAAFARGS